CVKVTMVPSGTAFPLQSRTGSVTSWSLSPDWVALIFNPQGSPGTCRTMRTLETSPTRAKNLSAPCCGVESNSVEAPPYRVDAKRDSALPEGFESSNWTGIGETIKLW